jgi:hypothetical protein
MMMSIFLLFAGAFPASAAGASGLADTFYPYINLVNANIIAQLCIKEMPVWVMVLNK